MIHDTAHLSYLQQLRLYRRFAASALNEYRLKVDKMEFIHHGENTTFRLRCKNRDYLLRIHRHGYHSTAAISEELRWLASLYSQNMFGTQRPIKTKNQKWVGRAKVEGFKPRQCSVLEWVPGISRYKSLGSSHLFKTGELLGKLHQSTSKKKSSPHRNYWTPEGLLGPQASMGPIQNLEAEFGKDFVHIEKARQLALKKLKAYQQKNPDRMGLIHADLHFGNVVWNQSKPTPIDFDDCGWGLHVYDLAVPLDWLRRAFKKRGKRVESQFTESLLEGYASQMSWGKDEAEILPWLLATRRLVLIGWTGNRRDHPDIWKYFQKSKKPHIKMMMKLLQDGPRPLSCGLFEK